MNDRELKDYYQALFQLTYYHKYSWSDLEDMPVFELDLLKDMITDAINNEKQMRELQSGIDTQGMHM